MTNSNITPESNSYRLLPLDPGSRRPIEPSHVFWLFFSSEGFCLNNLPVCNVAFLTPLKASSQPFFSSLSEVIQLGRIRAGPLVPDVWAAQPPRLPPLTLGAGACSRGWDGCRMNMNLASSVVSRTVLHDQKNFLFQKYEDSFFMTLFCRLLQLATFRDK